MQSALHDPNRGIYSAVQGAEQAPPLPAQSTRQQREPMLPQASRVQPGRLELDCQHPTAKKALQASAGNEWRSTRANQTNLSTRLWTALTGGEGEDLSRIVPIVQASQAPTRDSQEEPPHPSTLEQGQHRTADARSATQDPTKAHQAAAAAAVRGQPQQGSEQRPPLKAPPQQMPGAAAAGPTRHPKMKSPPVTPPPGLGHEPLRPRQAIPPPAKLPPQCQPLGKRRRRVEEMQVRQ